MRSAVLLRSSIALLILATGALSVFAQTDYSSRKGTRFLGIGAGFAGGASTTTEAPPTRKLSPIFAWRGTVDATYPLTPTVAAWLSFGIDSRGGQNHDENNSDFYAINRIAHFTITPGFVFSSFFLGCNFAFPLSGTVTVGANGNEASEDLSSSFFDSYNTIIEPRLGVVIPVMDEEVGWLGLTFIGGYQVNEIVDKSKDHYGSLHLGLTWQFAIPGTKRK